jgi:hypothetical protein
VPRIATSYVEVEPTLSGEERVAISFNLRGKWKYTVGLCRLNQVDP